MQSPRILRLAANIRVRRERTDRRGRKTPWRVVCLKVRPQILNKHGLPDTGLAYQIAYNGKEPDRAVQVRLGLPEVCIKCHRRFPKKRTRRVYVKSEARLWWEGLSHEDQDALLNRVFKIRKLM